MIQRFKKVSDSLFRGSKPSYKDVKDLKRNHGIKRIVTLCHDADEIKEACKDLHIQHVYIPFFFNKDFVYTIFTFNLNKLLNDKKMPTFIHCKHGKDRTGYVVALYQILFNNYTFDEAMKEALDLGYGVGVPKPNVKSFTNVIKKCFNYKQKNDNSDDNSASVVDNQRGYDDLKYSITQPSIYNENGFAPYLDVSKHPVYNSNYDQSQTRQNVKQNNQNETSDNNKEESQALNVGQFNNDAGVRGFGPTENYGGFFYD